jgi:signal transduction histidine kinase
MQVEDLAVEQERNRIAREIHDALGHSLTVFNLHLEAALRLLSTDPQEARVLLIEAKQVGATTLRDVRQSVAVLRADPLAGQSLATAITSLVEDLCRSSQITSQLHLTDAVLPEPIKVVVYRIVQEALTNICKYAQATNVEITVGLLAATKPDLVEQLQVRVKDNGRGFDPQQNTTGFGLQGMQERTLALGGEFRLLAQPGQGCEIQVSIPLAQSPMIR